MKEKHFTVNQLAKLWGYSAATIRNLFKYDPNVLRLQGPGAIAGKRPYLTLSIPESAAMKTYQRLKELPLKVQSTRKTEIKIIPVSYTHLTLPTNREV